MGTALDTGTQDRPGREQGPRAEGEEGSGGPPSNPGRVHTQEGEKNPGSKNMASPLGGFLTNILPSHPTASQPQTKTRASKAAQKVAGWREQGRGKDRTGEQTDRQTDRDVPASISRGPSLPDTHVIISTESDGTEGSVCCGAGWGGAVETTLFWDRKIRERDTHTRSETERERRLLHNFHFLPSTLKVMFYLTGSSPRGGK